MKLEGRTTIQLREYFFFNCGSNNHFFENSQPTQKDAPT